MAADQETRDQYAKMVQSMSEAMIATLEVVAAVHAAPAAPVRVITVETHQAVLDEREACARACEEYAKNLRFGMRGAGNDDDATLVRADTLDKMAGLIRFRKRHT